MRVAQISRHRRGDGAVAAVEFHFLLVYADFINQQPQVFLGECSALQELHAKQPGKCVDMALLRRNGLAESDLKLWHLLNQLINAIF
jgi:hypothetical protein